MARLVAKPSFIGLRKGCLSLGGTTRNVTKSPDVCPRLFRGRVARGRQRATHTAARPWDRRAWRASALVPAASSEEACLVCNGSDIFLVKRFLNPVCPWWSCWEERGRRFHAGLLHRGSLISASSSNSPILVLGLFDCRIRLPLSARLVIGIEEDGFRSRHDIENYIGRATGPYCSPAV
jgi:hypothetical protein